jgi:hypothetical protein
MQAYRRSFLVQMILFGIFLLMGANVILDYYLGVLLPWLNIAILALLVALGVFGFITYKKQDNSVVIVTQQEINTLKYLLYGYFVVYLAHIILSGMASIPQELLTIVVGALLMGIAIYGLYLHYKIIKTK